MNVKCTYHIWWHIGPESAIILGNNTFPYFAKNIDFVTLVNNYGFVTYIIKVSSMIMSKVNLFYLQISKFIIHKYL